MLSSLVAILVVALILLVLLWILRQFPLPAQAHTIVGVIFALILVIYALHRFGILTDLRL